MHVRFIPVLTQYAGNVCLIYLILHHDHHLTEVLQQQPEQYGYGEKISHGAKVCQ